MSAPARAPGGAASERRAAAASPAYAVLARIDAAVRTHMLPLPAADELPDRWSGIGFDVGGGRYVAPEGQVGEILLPPRTTKLPGVRDWILGVANVRGRLLAIADLADFLGLEKTGPRADRRVLLVGADDFEIGLLVEQSLGMQHFTPDMVQEGEPAPDAVAPFVGRSFRNAGRVWREMDLRALIRDPSFSDVAA